MLSYLSFFLTNQCKFINNNHFLQGRLNELLSQIRMRQTSFTHPERMSERYNIEPHVLDDLKQVATVFFTIIILTT